MIHRIWDGRDYLGEGPLWDPRHQCLYWVDILSRQLHQYDHNAGTHQKWTFEEAPCCLGLSRDGKLVAALASRFVKIELPSGRINSLHAPIDAASVMFNDGHCSPYGDFWAGTKDINEHHATGSILSISPQGEVRRHDEGFIVSNGLEWSPDGKILYAADSPNQLIYQYDYDKANNQLTNKKVFTSLTADEGYPDGITVDSEGYVWNAHFKGGRIVRYNPDGNKDQVYQLPVTYPTSCCFGGDDLTRLFITTATRDLTETQLEQESWAGSLLAIDTNVTGLNAHYFQG